MSNPPYIAHDDPVEPAVREWEPAEALFAGPDGLRALREVIAGAPAWLCPGGALVCEIGAEARPGGAWTWPKRPAWSTPGSSPTSAGRDRILVATKP